MTRAKSPFFIGRGKVIYFSWKLILFCFPLIANSYLKGDHFTDWLFSNLEHVCVRVRLYVRENDLLQWCDEENDLLLQWCDDEKACACASVCMRARTCNGVMKRMTFCNGENHVGWGNGEISLWGRVEPSSIHVIDRGTRAIFNSAIVKVQWLRWRG